MIGQETAATESGSPAKGGVAGGGDSEREASQASAAASNQAHSSSLLVDAWASRGDRNPSTTVSSWTGAASFFTGVSWTVAAGELGGGAHGDSV